MEVGVDAGSSYSRGSVIAASQDLALPISAAANFSEQQFETPTVCNKGGGPFQPRDIFPPQPSLDVLGGTGARCGRRFDHLDLERQ